MTGLAQRRMFSKKITETDTFLDMPLSSQCLYFHLNMNADDDGFIGNTKTIRRMVGASDDDLKILMTKEFLIPFEGGVVVIKDWKIHNYIQKDRYNETIYQDEKSMLTENKNKQYQTFQAVDTKCIQNGHVMETQVSKGKSKERIEEGEGNQYPAAAQTYSETILGNITPFMIEDLDFYKDKFDEPNEIIMEALDISVARGKRNWLKSVVPFVWKCVVTWRASNTVPEN